MREGPSILSMPELLAIMLTVGTKKEGGCRGRAGVGARGSIGMLGIRDGVGGGGCGIV